MHLHPVDPADLAHAWPVACTRPGCDLLVDDLPALGQAGPALLVLIVDADGAPVAAGVTQVRDLAEGGRSCCVLAVGGSGARSWRGTLALIEAGAARNGCSRVEFVGRVGWAALLPDYQVDAFYVKHLGVAA